MHQIIPLSAFYDNYIWLIMHPGNNTCLVVDPGDASPVIDYLEKNNLILSAILITHHHHDHTGGVSKLIAKAPQDRSNPLPVYGPQPTPLKTINHRLQEGDTVNFPDLHYRLQVLETPGHTTDHISYSNDHDLFCGDTLFAGGCGRLFEGTPTQLYHSLVRLSALNDATRVFCAHEYTEKNLGFASLVEKDNPDLITRLKKATALRAQRQPTLPSTIGLEKATNPFLRCTLPTVQQAATEYAGQPLTNPVEVFTTLRRWKDAY